MLAPATVARLVGPTITTVSVALARTGSPLHLRATFPTMVLADAPSGAEAHAYVASSRGAVEVRIEGSSDRTPLVALAAELGCPTVIASRRPGDAWGHTTLVVDGGVVWEEEFGPGDEAPLHRLASPALGIVLRGHTGIAATTAMLAAAWLRIDAHVDARIGDAAVRALSFGVDSRVSR